MERDSFDLGRWFGIPVRMHWTFLLSCAWLYLLIPGLWNILVGAATLLMLFVAHEFGHVLMLRWRRTSAVGITLNGLHGRTEHEWANPWNEALAAWGGVAAQLVLLLLALVLGPLLSGTGVAAVSVIATPALFVLTQLNIFFIVIALLPIGPFDGHAAWSLLPQLKRRFARRRAKPTPQKKLAPEQQARLEAESERAAAELIKNASRRASSTQAKRGFEE